jgi:uncharacterized protein (DUF4415 family)
MAIVSCTRETRPKRSEEDWARLAAMKDEDIDCSDIPEITDLSGLVPRPRGAMYKPVKVAVNCKLDADIVAWLKNGGKGYQTRLNAILRRVMLSTVTQSRQAAPQSR